MNIKTVTVLGANGTMGRNVSAIFASFGNAKVYMMARTIEKAVIAANTAYQVVKAESIRQNCIPVDYSSFEHCLRESDLVFESVAEELHIKQQITRQIGGIVRDSTIIVSGTSGLSIRQLSHELPISLRKNYFGMHMFNPPYSLTLCEIIATEDTDENLLTRFNSYAKKILHRTVIRVKDRPAFLGNRIGFQFMNEALQYAERCRQQGGIDYIDAILGPFTGRNMAPLQTVDFVGLDIHKAIVDNLYNNTDDYAKKTFELPEFVNILVSKGSMGKKTGSGLYKMTVRKNGEKNLFVFDIHSGEYRPRISYEFHFVDLMIEFIKNGDYDTAFKVLLSDTSKEANICVEFLLKYIIYALKTSEEVAYDVRAVDDAMSEGFCWCPPLSLLYLFSRITSVQMLLQERLGKGFVDLSGVDVEKAVYSIGKSKYDYRKYIRAIRK